MKKGESIELTIDSLAFGGEGVGKKDGLVVFVKGALPGQKICAQIARKKKSHFLRKGARPAQCGAPSRTRN